VLIIFNLRYIIYIVILTMETNYNIFIQSLLKFIFIPRKQKKD